MMNILPDLRVTIAEGMEALARVGCAQPWRYHYDGDAEWTLMRGAQTLRWCADREAPSYDELEVEIDNLEDMLQAVEKAIDAPGQTMAQRMARIREVMK